MKTLRPLIFAHRGYSKKYPENTGIAFRQALLAGADGVECDLQRLDDGNYVILHDATLDRTSNGKGPAGAVPLSRLRLLDFGQGERILTLDELLALLGDEAWLNLELKKDSVRPEDSGEILSILRGAGRSGRNTHISSFRHDLLPSYRRAGFETGMLIGEEHQGVSPLAYFRWVLRYRPTCLNLPVQAFERVPKAQLTMLFRIFRILGRKLCFWTVNMDSQFAQVRPWADAVITDDVPAAIQALRSRSGDRLRS